MLLALGYFKGMVGGMELRHLRYFVAVAEEENVTRAAMRLHLSQPPLSRQIRDLEEELRVTLFKRTAKSLSLTAAGQVFLEQARAVLDRADEAIRIVRAAAGGGEGEIHIGYAPSPTGEFLSNVLHVFEKAMPGVRVSLHDMTSAEILTGLRSRKLNAGLLVEQKGAALTGFRFELLRSYRVGVIMPKSHPLAKRRLLRLEEVRKEPVAVLSRKDYGDYHSWLQNTFGIAAKKFCVAEECDGALSLIASVESGRAISFSAESIMSVAGGRLAFVRLSPAPQTLRVGVCYPSDMAPGSATANFVEAARSVGAMLARESAN